MSKILLAHALTAFIGDEQWKLLNKQAEIMDQYSDVLAKRIALF